MANMLKDEPGGWIELTCERIECHANRLVNLRTFFGSIFSQSPNAAANSWRREVGRN